jgi:hypothetical protein
MITIDLMVKGFELPIVNFIKVDLEGYEFDVLKGATNVISTYHPSILMEIDHKWLARYNSTSDNIRIFMDTFGCKLFIAKDSVFVQHCEVKLVVNVYFMWV